jgi:diguanylate cyclase (GGDEF)-like protein
MVQAGPTAARGALLEAPVGRRDLREFVTDQLRIVLEQRAVRFMCIGVMLVLGSFLSLVQTPIEGVDTGWLFIVPVAISAIASGLMEGLFVALCASILAGIYGTALNGGVDEALIVSIISGRFALYGLTAAFLGLFAEAHYAVQMNLRELAATDPLTKVSNVASFYEELGVLESGQSTFAVLVVDVDDLKVLNDRYGHQVGSSAIQAVANVLKRVVRSSDCVARYGGDEFVVILKDADRAGAQIVANRVREMLTEERLPGAPEARVSVSVGVALYGEDGTTSDELLAVSDRAMYEDKRSRKANSRHTALMSR